MTVVGAITILAVVLIFAVLVLSLVKVISQLRKVTWTLGAIIVGVNAIAYQTRTIPEVIPRVNANLAPVRSLAEQL
ncbi:MAG: hypothetical protein M3319_14980 [Actinomycetota bacterium]|jgi:hypothetical protein|nr:hypothetical protein [Actinomycetota bacterium]MDQ3901678.1 hypothetical protein [Actinomycetota bacterium]